uniref:Uncharacterized protein n=1 Tax=Arundo donax TaxID=35708 RepID=A0A0A9GNQ2_ARUDO
MKVQLENGSTQIGQIKRPQPQITVRHRFGSIRRGEWEGGILTGERRAQGR